MAKRMLIDATHPEETRVVVLNGNRIEEFDFETSTKRQIKGNIYLAKVTRVEPSLQAAFVEYGGNRHGFLAFSEIHPDYYQIPVSDREAMIAAEAAEHHDDDHDEPPAYEVSVPDEPSHAESFAAPAENDAGTDYGVPSLAASDGIDSETAYAPAETETSGFELADGTAETGFAQNFAHDGETHFAEPHEHHDHDHHEHEAEAPEPLETVGGDDIEEAHQRSRVHYRNYKIQEVIKRRQILLVQVTKEERGNKGAALTTYLSLAGRYCVLMPNAGRGGGVSRKITSVADRRRLKELMEELGVPDGMGVIVRTAGSERPKAEIHRDYEYLMRLWDDIRELTLRSSAPAFIYEEGNLIKRAIRDLYSRDMEEILVEGEEGYRTAKEFMRMLTPGHAARVKPYRDPSIPLLHRFQVDGQIDQIHNPTVQLKSGGYIVINPTEALVAIDVNSGRSTKERNIEETATKTNLEAAEEIARQLRLRDLAGLIVIDFIDMEESRNRNAVERRLKEAMKNDRARIQLGRISPFGLLELSRQRLRSSLIEASTQVCPHCGGTGTIRSTESTALVVLRALEEEGIRRRTAEITLYVPTGIALYILNQKRDALVRIEQRYGFRVLIQQDDTLVPPAYRLDRIRAFTPAELAALPVAQPIIPAIEEEEDPEPIEDEFETAEAEGDEVGAREDGANGGEGSAEEKRGRRRRRRRRRGGHPEGADGARPNETSADGTEEDGEEPEGDAEAEGTEGEVETIDAVLAAQPQGEETSEQRRRRRGRRGGRRRHREDGTPGAATPESPEAEAAGEEYDYDRPAIDYARDGREHLFDQEPGEAPIDAEPVNASEPAPAAEAPIVIAETTDAETEAKPKRRRAPRRKAGAAEAETPVTETVEAEPVPVAEAPPAKPRRSRKKVEPAAAEAAPTAESAPIAETAEPAPASVEPAPEPVAEAPAPVAVAPEPQPVAEPEPVVEQPAEERDPNQPRRSGWWRRLVE
jgi:ribonuclease E